MQSQKGTKLGIWILLIICISQGVYIYFSEPSRPDPTKVVSVTHVGEGGAIYEILYDSGGATVPLIYRYFLMDIQANDQEALKKSTEREPFLVTKSPNAVRKVIGDSVKLKTSETIYDFHNVSIYKNNGKINIVTFDLVSTVK
ncbi:hypothetical protein [Pseudomonas sp. Marseille-Q1929]|uniref:hypothetical protein n=1 Tax=Pseudomonas sp. Marseille-Q1929 TaxID=2730402 RepID=UPI001A90034F|nr:hypothetical protein [Pseudomonas sp. Marseille-Q1929]MBO0496385.1 hypothetical protein [Pseudomonas sp. Marseille-Q1929]